MVDPVAVLSQSLWLSASAVAALLFWYQWVPLPDWPLSRAGRQFLALAHLQLGITLLLLPVQIAMFHGFSLTSFPANLFAVPLVTFVSVPLILAGMIVHLAGLVMIESNLWYLADRSLALLFWGSGACLKGGSILMHAGNGSHFTRNDDYRMATKYLAYATGGLFLCATFAEWAALACTAYRCVASAYAGCRAGAGDGDCA